MSSEQKSAVLAEVDRVIALIQSQKFNPETPANRRLLARLIAELRRIG